MKLQKIGGVGSIGFACLCAIYLVFFFLVFPGFGLRGPDDWVDPVKCIAASGVVMQTTVRVEQGELQGVKQRRLHVFHGVPYATAERFQPPKPMPAWNGVRQATMPGVICPQLPSRLELVMGTPKIKRTMSEDCQVLSIYSPDLKGKRPVMVWIHGGAFITGGGEEAWYDASRLADEGDVVVVTITYRLGAFGYLYTDEYGATNAGLQDQLAALQWIHANIARFGGDSESITLFGQSAGGYSIASILATAKRPSLRRVIIQSAPLDAMSEQAAKDVGRKFLQILGKSPLVASTDEILAAQKAVLATSKLGLAFAPIGVNPQTPVLSGEGPADFLIGWTRDDAAPFIALQHSERPYGGPIDRIKTILGTRKMFSAPNKALAAGLRANHKNVAVYQVDWRPHGSRYGACHCIELPLLFGQPSDWDKAPMLGDAPEQEMEQFGCEARAMWAEFAKSGTPPKETAWLKRPHF